MLIYKSIGNINESWMTTKKLNPEPKENLYQSMLKEHSLLVS